MRKNFLVHSHKFCPHMFEFILWMKCRGQSQENLLRPACMSKREKYVFRKQFKVSFLGEKNGLKREATIELTILSQAATFPSFEAFLAVFSLFFPCCSRMRSICILIWTVDVTSGVSNKKERISK